MNTLLKPLAVLTVLSCFTATLHADPVRLSPSEIIDTAPDSAWRALDLENILLLDLATGTVIIELNPLLAPNHVSNIKKLAREGFYKNLNMYRFVEGFVAQGGDLSEQKKVIVGKKAIPAEFYHQTEAPLVMTLVDDKDGYAAKTGFINGFAVAQNSDSIQTWQTHCPGTFAMARSDSPDSGGTEFYVALGTLRYLDRNITAFGRVIDGMEHLQRLDRKPKNDSEAAQHAFNPILDMVVAADVKKTRPVNLEIMDTSSAAFSDLVASRRNRPSSWFIETPNYTDVCAVSVPSRPAATQ